MEGTRVQFNLGGVSEEKDDASSDVPLTLPNPDGSTRTVSEDEYREWVRQMEAADAKREAEEEERKKQQAIDDFKESLKSIDTTIVPEDKREEMIQEVAGKTPSGIRRAKLRTVLWRFFATIISKPLKNFYP